VIKRYLVPFIRKDLGKKMVFVAGPRQVGKTTMALRLLDSDQGYLNWDIPEHREMILRRALPAVPMLVFDEIHKYRSWRNYLKGLCDASATGRVADRRKMLVTGSARLDLYRHGGDSLQGRYHMHRLHPLSTAELKLSAQADFLDLIRLGGFPEPFFSSSELDARRWSRDYRTRLIQEEIRSLERVDDLGRLELLALRLPDLVGSPLSINALREDLQVAHTTAAHWLTILEKTYAIFRIPPFGAPRIRAVKKEQKHYQFDWTLVADQSRRFENLVACHLLKWTHHRQDAFGEDIELRYFRDVDGREVDFVLTERGSPTHLIEVKWNETEPANGLRYLKMRFSDARALQISAVGKKDYLTPDGIRVQPALDYLRELI
jgi:predicted AAA+ superfamily ATPase